MDRISSPVRFEIDGARFDKGQLLVSGRSLAGEALNDVLFVQPHGAASFPPKGAIGIGLPMPGRRGQMLILGVEAPEHRPDLPQGAAALYDASGNMIRLTASGVTLDFQSRTVTLTGGQWNFAGDVSVSGNVTATGNVTIEGSLRVNGPITSDSPDAEEE